MRRGRGWTCQYGPAAAAMVGALALVTAAPAGAPAPAPASRPAASPPASQPCGHRPVTLDLLQEYLKRWNVTDTAVDAEQRCVRFNVVVEGQTRLKCVVQIKVRRDGTSFDRLYFACLELLNVPSTDPRLAEVLRAIASLNFQNTLAAYAWDETDGEIRLEYTMLANDGLCYRDFADVLTRLTWIAHTDRKYLAGIRFR
jgi:hypothetical protein